MANIESNTLLEKLTIINECTCNLRQTLKDVGGKDIVTDSTSLAEMSSIIKSIYSDVVPINVLLNTIVNGTNKNESGDDTTYITMLPYIESLGVSKKNLVTNLELLGVSASIDEPLEDLIQKILLIRD